MSSSADKVVLDYMSPESMKLKSLNKERHRDSIM